jgi:hypothetical protein
VQIDDVLPLGLEEAEHDAAPGAPRRQCCTATRAEPDAHHMRNRRLDPACGKGRRHLLALEGKIGGALQVLQGAAPAMGEVAALRRDTLRRGRKHVDKAGAIAALLDQNLLARQRIRHVNRARRRLGDAVALGAEARDVDCLRVTHPCTRR